MSRRPKSLWVAAVVAWSVRAAKRPAEIGSQTLRLRDREAGTTVAGGSPCRAAAGPGRRDAYSLGAAPRQRANAPRAGLKARRADRKPRTTLSRRYACHLPRRAGAGRVSYSGHEENRTVDKKRLSMLCIGLGASLFVVCAQQQPRVAAFTAPQTEAGRLAYEKTCVRCHTTTLMGRTGAEGELPRLESL